MNWKQTFILGISGSLLSSLASIIYWIIYKEAMVVDFSMIVGVPNIIAACCMGCFLMAIGYKWALQWKGAQITGWIHSAYCVFSFATISGVFGFNMPLDTESPELFPGMIVPMHFFPVLSMLTIFPFFKLIDHHKI